MEVLFLRGAHLIRVGSVGLRLDRNTAGTVSSAGTRFEYEDTLLSLQMT